MISAFLVIYIYILVIYILFIVVIYIYSKNASNLKNNIHNSADIINIEVLFKSIQKTNIINYDNFA